MLEYINNSLIPFQHTLQTFTDQLHKQTIPLFGATIKYETAADTSNKLDDDGKKFRQQVTSTFLYYAQAVDPKMMVTHRTIASRQEAPTESTMEKAKYFLDYEASHPYTIMSYSSSNMVLAAHSDASYLTKPKARSRSGGHFFMSNNSANP